jgi:hypothetical protein
MKFGVAVATAVAVLISGCGTVKSNLTPETPIDPTEGFIVSDTRCGSGVYSTEWYPSGVRSKGYTGAINFAFVLGCNRGTLVYAVPAGTYFMGKAVGMTYLDYPESDTWSFTVQAGKLNYVGDFYVAVEEGMGARLVSPAVVTDRSTSARRALQTSYPWMLERYEFVTALAQRTNNLAPRTSSATP